MTSWLNEYIHFDGLYFLVINILFITIVNYIIKHKKYFISSKGRKFLDMGEHATKHATPTMGGIAFFIILPILCYKSSQKSIFIALCAALASIVGGIDDWLKLNRGNGLSVKLKFMAQIGAAFIPAYYYFFSFHQQHQYINFFNYHISCGYFIIPWIVLVIMSTTHAINLTDGIDGLAILTTIITVLTLIAITTTITHQNVLFFISFLEVCILFFLYNKYPAKIFMGDIGAFFLGGLISGLFLSEKIELLLPFAGISFVWSAISVILQYLIYKTQKRRLFLFAPYHHALEKKGHSETKICLLYCLLQIIGGFIAIVFFTLFF